MQLAVINFGNFVMVGEYVQATEKELVLRGALSYQGASTDMEKPEFMVYPLGAPHMTPQKDLETRIRFEVVPSYTLMDADSVEQDICVKYRSFWG